MTAGICPAILAGGLGTRLRPAVGDRPKVLAEVIGRPFLAYLLDRLRDAGFDEAVLLVGFGAGQVRAAFGERYRGMRLRYSVEQEPRGTGGAVRLAESLFCGRPVLLMNGDSWCEVDLPAFTLYDTDHPGELSLCLARVPDTSRFGRVVCDRAGQVVRFAEKAAGNDPGWINAGLYLIGNTLLADIPDGRPVSLERDMLPGWVARGIVHGFQGGDRFIDIGVPEAYRAADDFFRPPAPVPGAA